MPLKAVLFDMDGTLTKFNLDVMTARRRALAELERMGLRDSDLTEALPVYQMLKKLKPKLRKAQYQSIKAKLFGIVEEMELQAAYSVTLYAAGTHAILDKLRSMGLKLGVVTNNGKHGTELTLTKLGLKEYFDVIITRADAEEIKPDPGSIREALRKLSVNPSEVIFVGDGVIDIEASKAAGVKSVTIPTGLYSLDRLLAAGPDYMAASIEMLSSLVDSIRSTNFADA